MTTGRRMAALLAPALALGLLGCRAPAPSPPPNVEIPRYRWNLDDQAGVVRVVGEVVNLGTTTVPQLEIKALLLGASGDARGENMTPILHDLAPGEKRQFALNVTSHGGVSRVDLQWQVPKRNR